MIALLTEECRKGKRVYETWEVVQNKIVLQMKKGWFVCMRVKM